MEYIVRAELEIDGTRIEHYTSITLKQGFNAHHEFTIRLNHDVIEDTDSFSLSNAQNKIGKSTIIKFQKMDISNEVSYEFRGIITEVRMEQSGRSGADLVLIGSSPTIILENGQNLASFYKSDLAKIVQKVTKPLGSFNCNVELNNEYKKPITYICQYRESAFQFLNRLSAEFSEFFYYDGKDLHFGKPTSTDTIDVAYGEDISNMELSLRISPMNFTNYAYLSKDDKVEKYDSPKTVDGLDQYASHVLNESNNLFSEPVIMPIRQRINSKSDLENFVKKQKAAMAAELETLTGTSHNPEIRIGCILNVQISRLDNSDFIRDDYGKFLVTSIEHFTSSNGRYYNRFEAIPSGLKVLPVCNIIMPLAEPQLAIVKDNKDPDSMGRVRVQMLWQQGNDMTDWIRVMTPDAGGGKGGAKNRGFVAVPESGDQVLVCFRYNDPDRPFVMGSMFHGKSGGGGGGGNKTKSLTALSGSIVLLDGDAITIKDPKDNFINIDGIGNITVKSSESIALICGSSSITLKKDGTITIDGVKIEIKGSSEAVMKSQTAKFKAEGVKAEMSGVMSEVKGDAQTKIGGAMIEINSMGIVDIKGAMIKKNG